MTRELLGPTLHAMAVTEAAAGRPRAAAEALGRLRSIDLTTALLVQGELAALPLLVHESGEIRSIRDSLRARRGSFAAPNILEGPVDLSLVTAELRLQGQVPRQVPRQVPLRFRVWARLFKAEMLEALGLLEEDPGCLEEALAWYRSLLVIDHGPWVSVLGPMRLGRARILERLGDPEGAAEEYLPGSVRSESCAPDTTIRSSG